LALPAAMDRQIVVSARLGVNLSSLLMRRAELLVVCRAFVS